MMRTLAFLGHTAMAAALQVQAPTVVGDWCVAWHSQNPILVFLHPPAETRTKWPCGVPPAPTCTHLHLHPPDTPT